LFHGKIINCTILVPLQQSLLPPMASFVGHQARVLPVSSYVWNLGTFHLPISRNQDWADQPCILHISSINPIIRRKKAALTFSIAEKVLSQHIAFTYVLQPIVTTPPVQRIWEEFLPKFRPWQDGNQERATKIDTNKSYGSMDMWTLWQNWCSVTLSHPWSPPPCKGSKKNSHHSFSLWPRGTAEKLPIK
jgi:hypothetical protein